MIANLLQFIRDYSDRIRDLAGFGFFLFATLVSGLVAWQHPSILAWLYVIHNGLLASFIPGELQRNIMIAPDYGSE